jgi:hypothetical protein
MRSCQAQLSVIPRRRCGGAISDADQTIVDEQANGGKFLKEMLLHQLAHRSAHPLFIAWTFRLEDVGERRLMPIGLVQQRASLG